MQRGCTVELSVSGTWFTYKLQPAMSNNQHIPYFLKYLWVMESFETGKIAHAVWLEEVFKEWFKQPTISPLLTFSPFKHRIVVHLALCLLPKTVKSICLRSLYRKICSPHQLYPTASPEAGKGLGGRKCGTETPKPKPSEAPPSQSLPCLGSHSITAMFACCPEDIKLPEICLFLPRGVASFSN